MTGIKVGDKIIVTTDNFIEPFHKGSVHVVTHVDPDVNLGGAALPYSVYDEAINHSMHFAEDEVEKYEG